MSAREEVQRRWDDLAARRGLAGPAADAVLEEIAAAYGEPHRHYHTLEHIAALLALFERYGEGVADPDALTLAILFHDAVYDPARQDNEAASAALAAERLEALEFASALTTTVSRYILATRHGESAAAAAEPALALLLDLDLSILGAAPGEYRAYAEAIRREFGFVPDRVYRPARRRVLQDFLTRERIYLTDRPGASWERPARANLAGEIAELASHPPDPEPSQPDQ